MKKILFILGITFSLYSYAKQGISITETDTYQELSKKIELKKEKPDIYSFKTNLDSILGIKIDDQYLIGKRTVGFDKDSKVCFVSVIIGGKRGVSLAPRHGDSHRPVEIMYHKIRDSFLMIIKSKRKGCDNIDIVF